MLASRKCLIASLCALSAACSTPSHIRVSDSSRRVLDSKVGWTDQSTVSKCVSNMINASPAAEAVDVSARHSGTGKTIVVDVDATLINLGPLGVSKAVSYRCDYKAGVMVKGSWTRGL